MKFTKMQGCGNDYVYVNGFTAQERKCAETASAAWQNMSTTRD